MSQFSNTDRNNPKVYRKEPGSCLPGAEVMACGGPRKPHAASSPTVHSEGHSLLLWRVASLLSQELAFPALLWLSDEISQRLQPLGCQPASGF